MFTLTTTVQIVTVSGDCWYIYLMCLVSSSTHPFSSLHHFIFTPSHYTVVTYIVSGRVDEASEWVVISEGDLPWRYWTSFPRNSRGLGIASTYESGDSDRTYTEVFFEENAAAFLHYKVQFPDSRDSGSNVQFSEVELPGILSPDAPNSGPTNLPTKLPTSLPPATTPPPTANPTNSVSFYANIDLMLCRLLIFEASLTDFVCFFCAYSLLLHSRPH